MNAVITANGGRKPVPVVEKSQVMDHQALRHPGTQGCNPIGRYKYIRLEPTKHAGYPPIIPQTPEQRVASWRTDHADLDIGRPRQDRIDRTIENEQKSMLAVLLSQTQKDLLREIAIPFEAIRPSKTSIDCNAHGGTKVTPHPPRPEALWKISYICPFTTLYGLQY